MKHFILLLLLALAACAPAAKAPRPPAVPPPAPAAVKGPQFEKTFGSISIGQDGAMAIAYKNLTLDVQCNKDGSPEINGANPGKRAMLKKDDDFVFVTALQNRGAGANATLNSYLLEFDNGRNLFLSGEIANPDDLREFIYNLRDDGREIYAGFFYGRAGASAASLAKTIGLLQPINALVLQVRDSGPSISNEAAFRSALKEEFFEGAFVILKSGSDIPF